MLRSLVGSEMCIRDSINTPYLLQTAPASVRRGTLSNSTKQQLLLLENNGDSVNINNNNDDDKNQHRPNTAPSATSSLPLIPSSSSSPRGSRGDPPPPLRLSREVQQRLMTPVSYTHLTLPTKRIV
eukprot:TRINITY_DN30865_c0_g1_i1.p1 TRINITY_DN30865_c0_g1~~TRINITY_DN30865_c0_g1_i1.p1  ORF type:complete len:126 (+),score=29.97 TRINITY_DN30865_c0_g1_i1:140-517(+)